MMESGLLLTKFFTPEPRPRRVSRRRLLEQLDRLPPGSLVIVSAPAGFGKTSLVSEWVHSSGVNCAWVSLDEGDSDPVRFWTCLVMAVERLFPGVCENSQRLLTDTGRPSSRILLTSLLNDLSRQVSQPGEKPACLVLDDLQRVSSPEVYEGLLLFIERLPPCLRLVLIGRSDPALPLGRLRASCRLLEIRLADLRFTLEESAAFLEQVMGFAVSPQQVQRLAERTEGWIAGLQLAGLAMQGLVNAGGPDDTETGLQSFIENFSGSDRFVLDYLVEEVLGRLPEDARAFLLQTSILDRICGPLCDALTGQPQGSGQAMLERFEHDNLFLIPLDNRRTWYRFHHLFADLLRHQFSAHSGSSAHETAAALHRRAAGWLAGQGYFPEAIEHALQGEDYERAAAWIEAYAWNGIARGEYATLRRWSEALPEALLYARPVLLTRYTWVLSYLGEVKGYERPLAAAERLFRQQGNPPPAGEALNLRADFAVVYGDGARARELALQALDVLPGEDSGQRGLSAMYLGSGALLLGEMQQARQAFADGRELCRSAGSLTGMRMNTLGLAEVCKAQGDLPRAAGLLEEVLQQTGDLPVYEGLIARMLLSMIWSEWNRLDEAEQAARRLLAAAEDSGQAGYLNTCWLLLARILWEKGDIPGMLTCFERQAVLAEQMNDLLGLSVGRALRAGLAAVSGEMDTALRWLESCGLSPDDEPAYREEPLYLALCLLLVRLGADDARRAAALLERMQVSARSQQRTASLIEILLLKALALSSLNDLPSALSALEESLSLAQPAGYMRLYPDEGRPVIDLLGLLLRKAALSPGLRTYVRQILTCAAQPLDETGTQAANLSLIEPLTARELEVLRLIRAGCANREIAERLYLSLNTVKVHVKNIFAKLQVENRTQAVRVAEDLGLI